jgi:hypothetical protein
MAALRFIQNVFGGKPEDTYILIWTLPNKTSHWFKDYQKAAIFVKEKTSGMDVYAGIGLSPKNYGESNRCKADNIAGIPGLWLDVDYGKSGHKKGNLPATIDEARSLIAEMGAMPTLVVHSGHGLQAYWLFNSFWQFESSEDRQDGAKLSELWNAKFRQLSKEHGYDCDSTYDLARIMRVPGTKNLKDEPLDVTIIEFDGQRHSPKDLLKKCQGVKLSSSSKSQRTIEPDTKGIGRLALKADANPPFEKFEVLSEIEPKFESSWKHERSKKDMQDQSPSSYDLSLASYAVQAGWTDQEIVDLLIAHRRKHGCDLKLREDYYENTIAKARIQYDREQAQEQIDENAFQDHSETPEDRREEILKSLSSVFGVPITRIVKYVADQPSYRLVLASSSIMLGDITGIVNQNAFRNKVAAACNILISRCTEKQWQSRAQAMLDACEEEILAEATEEGTVYAWLSNYLDDKNPIMDVDDASANDHPFMKDGHTHIFGAALRKWLVIRMGEKVSAKVMGTYLRGYGCESVVVAVTENGRKTTRNVWRIPEKEG